MTAIYEFGVQDADTYSQYVDVFMGTDASGDDLLTWSELNAALPTMIDAGEMSTAQIDAVFAFF